MYLVVGLGNPGKQYEATRHNMGFDTIDVLVERHKIPQGGVKFNAMYGSGFIGGEKVIFMKPLSFMNLSGGPVQEMAAYFKIDPESELIIIQDDIDLEPGQLRIRKQGSAGGHNGSERHYRQTWYTEIRACKSWCRSQTKRMGSGRPCAWTFFIRRTASSWMKQLSVQQTLWKKS